MFQGMAVCVGDSWVFQLVHSPYPQLMSQADFLDLTGSEPVHLDSRPGNGADMGSCERLSAGLDLYSRCCDERVSLYHAP